MSILMWDKGNLLLFRVPTGKQKSRLNCLEEKADAKYLLLENQRVGANMG